MLKIGNVLIDSIQISVGVSHWRTDRADIRAGNGVSGGAGEVDEAAGLRQLRLHEAHGGGAQA